MPLIYLFNKFPTVAALPPAARLFHVLLLYGDRPHAR